MCGDASGIFFMLSYFVVAIGGALGSVGRFWLSGAIAQKFGETFPAGTLFVNISGSLIIGFFAALTGPDGRIWSSPSFRQFFMIGVLGGYTTFSSFTLLHIPHDLSAAGTGLSFTHFPIEYRKKSFCGFTDESI